jgi:disulfide bond formation protein DsbB
MSVVDAYGIVALLIIVVTLMVWFQKIKAVRVPKVRFHYFSLMIIGAILGIYTVSAGAGWIGKAPAILAIGLGFMFPAFRLGSAQGEHKPAVGVGDPIIDFTAVDDKGSEFDLASLKGTPFLLKFFRGHW